VKLRKEVVVAYLKTISRNLPGDDEKNNETSVRMDGNQAEIRTGFLPDRSLLLICIQCMLDVDKSVRPYISSPKLLN
jgi:hypothetical protein